MNYVTFGGVTVGLCLLIRFLVGWYPGHKALRSSPLDHVGKLAPFLISWCYGCLTTLGLGGLIGWASGMALWISNWLGDAMLVWGVGGSWQVRSGDGSALPLTEHGSAVCLLMTVGMVAAMKKSRHSSDLKTGAWCGICLGTSAGVAGFAAVPLSKAASWLGGVVYGAFQ